MIVRAFSLSDNRNLRKIHARFYSEEFEFPDFLNNFICTFVIEDDNGDIVTAGGIKLIPEIQLLTDKNKSVRTRVSALYKVLEISNHICSKHGYTFFIAAVKDQKWLKTLLKLGFRISNGQSIVFDVR